MVASTPRQALLCVVTRLCGNILQANLARMFIEEFQAAEKGRMGADLRLDSRRNVVDDKSATRYPVNIASAELSFVALGAGSWDVLRLVLTEAFILATSGVAVGLLGALALNRLMVSLLYGTRPTDPTTFAAIAITLIGTALLSNYIPARRATKVDPMAALRSE